MNKEDLEAIEKTWGYLPVVAELIAKVRWLEEARTTAIQRLDGADYDLGRAIADGEVDNDRVSDAWRGVREARVALGEEL